MFASEGLFASEDVAPKQLDTLLQHEAAAQTAAQQEAEQLRQEILQLRATAHQLQRVPLEPFDADTFLRCIQLDTTATRPRRQYIQDPVERPISVRHLRSIAGMIRRLCKARLLKCDDSLIAWYEINLYHITDKVLKPVITYLLKPEDQPESHAQDWSCSWSELVGFGPQKPEILVSHWWGGRFHDFIGIVDKLVEDRSLSVNTPLWVCTFAINQVAGENFGTYVHDTAPPSDALAQMYQRQRPVGAPWQGWQVACLFMPGVAATLL